MDNQSTVVTKLRRATQACDFCRGRSIKCKPDPEFDAGSHSMASIPSCLTCVEYGRECIRSRQPKKRGTKPRAQVRLRETKLASHGDDPLDDNFKLRLQQRRRVLTALLDIYLDTIHPLFPVFCERELWVGWREGTFPHNISEYTCLITMCALSAQHAKNGALFNDEKSQLEVATWASEYLQEALSLVPMDFSLMNHLDLMRSYGFLALLGTQIGESSMVQKYLGLYHGICGRYGLHEESRWPPNISACDREVRRRIFWSIYRLEVHTACVLGHYVRIPEAQCDVGYPCGIHHPAFVPGRDGSFEDWFSGWNYSTDLYRILEHAAVSFRMRRRMHPPSLELNDGLSSGVLSKKLSIIKDGLLPQYERAFLRSEDNGRNRCGFQAANIFCIIHLVRMLTSLSDDHDLDSICDTAEEMIASMRQIPPEYVRACGATLLQQVAGVGHMLCVVAINEPPSTHSLHRLRLVLESITTFLETSKQHHDPLATAASRLREHLGKLRSADDVAGTGIMHPADEMGVPPTVEGHDSWISELDEYGTISGFGHEIFPATFLGDITWPFAWSSAPSLSD